MAIRVSPTEPNPTHDISLTDGVTTIGLHLCDPRGRKDRRAMRQVSTPRTSLQIQQGDPTYSGYTLPYTFITQKDWSGGRGQLELRRDSTKYYDSYNIDTRFGGILLGPKRMSQTGYKQTIIKGAAADGTIDYTKMIGTYYPLASEFTPSESFTMRSVKVKLRKNVLSNAYDVQVALWSSTGSEPNAQLVQSVAIKVTSTSMQDYTIPLRYDLVSGTEYWLLIFDSGGGLLVGYDTSEAGSTVMGNGASMTAWETVHTDRSLYFEISSVGRGKMIFFEYRNTEMVVSSPEDGGAPRLFMNGYHGMATSNSTDKAKLNTALDLSDFDATGGVVQVFKGPGAADETNWRKIESQSQGGSNDYFLTEYDDEWGTTHTAATEFATMGVDFWQEITGHGLTARVTSVIVVGDYVYFAQGDLVNVRRGTYDQTASGSMSDPAEWTWDAEGNIATTYIGATFLSLIPTTTGTFKIWAAQASTSKVYSADPATSWADLTWAQANGSKVIGNPATKITGMVGYGDPRAPWIFKEDGFGSITSDVYGEVSISELASVRSELNGRANVQHGVYLHFSMLEGFERYYEQRLDDMGPNRDEGLPETRRGHIAHAISYAGQVIACIDAGRYGYSSIFSYTELGWHELYRSASLGKRIRYLHIQPIPGDTVDRLWFGEEEDIYWLPIAINPLKQPDYPFTDTGYLITSWIETGFAEIIKFWKSLAVFALNLSASHQTITVSYQTDGEGDDDAWHALPSTFDTSPVEEVLLSAGYNVTGKQIRFKVALTSDDETVSPHVRAYTVEGVTRVPPARQWGATFQADDITINDAEGDVDEFDMYDLLSQLEEWANSNEQAAPLLMRSVLSKYDNKYVFIDAPNVQLREVAVWEDQREVKAIGNLSITEA